MKKTFFLLLFVNSYTLFGQFSERVIVEAGIIARVTAFQYSGTNRLANGRWINNIPYTPEKGVDGFGANLTIGYKLLKKPEISIRAGTTFRYDFLYWDATCHDCERKTTYFDQTFSVTKSIFGNGYIGVGYTMFNIGKILYWEDTNGVHYSFPLHFNSWDVLAAFRVWKLMVEPKSSIIGSGFPSRIRNTGDIFAIRFYYRFRL